MPRGSADSLQNQISGPIKVLSEYHIKNIAEISIGH